MTMFCQSSVDHAAISVIPPAHPGGWVNTEVTTNGSPEVVTLGEVVVSEEDAENVELVDKNGVETTVNETELVGVTPEVTRPTVSSWPKTGGKTPKVKIKSRRTDCIMGDWSSVPTAKETRWQDGIGKERNNEGYNGGSRVSNSIK